MSEAASPTTIRAAGLRPGLLLLAGTVLTGLALAWWFIIFGTIVREGYGSYGQAGPCLWGNSGYTCQLMLSLCTLDYRFLPKAYRPELFQAGIALLLAGAFLALARTGRRRGPTPQAPS